MIKTVNAQLSYPYVPECDRELPESEQTVFTLRPLLRREDKDLQDRIISFSDNKVSGYLALADAQVELALQGWSNVVDGEGNQVKFDPSRRKEMLEMLPSSIVDELVVFYRELTTAPVPKRTVETVDQES